MPSLLPRLDLADLEPMANRHTTEQLFPGRRSGHRASPRAQLDKVGHIPAIPAAKAPTSAGEPGSTCGELLDFCNQILADNAQQSLLLPSPARKPASYRTKSADLAKCVPHRSNNSSMRRGRNTNVANKQVKMPKIVALRSVAPRNVTLYCLDFYLT